MHLGLYWSEHNLYFQSNREIYLLTSRVVYSVGVYSYLYSGIMGNSITPRMIAIFLSNM